MDVSHLLCHTIGAAIVRHYPVGSIAAIVHQADLQAQVASDKATSRSHPRRFHRLFSIGPPEGARPG